MGSGAVFFDYDMDGDADLYFVNSGPVPEKNVPKSEFQAARNALFQNEGNGRFTDVTDPSGTGDTGYGMAASAGDIDNDGDLDLYVCNFGQDTLYQNNGDGTFTDITKAAGIDNSLWGIAAVFLDYDLDGDLDIFVVNYLIYQLSMPVTTYKGIVGYGHPRSYEGTADVLYRNNGDGTFTNVADIAGLVNPSEGRGMAAVVCDYDNDRFPDIYVANDTGRNFLYHNNRDGTFTDESLFLGVGYDENGVAEGSMGVDVGDYNRDGWFDIIVANSEKATLYKLQNLGDGDFFFEEATVESLLQKPTLPFVGFSPLFLDYDNDGHLDIFCANGHPQEVIEQLTDYETFAQRDQLFHNNGDGTYTDVSQTSGAYFLEKLVGRAAASADYDNDGDIDIVVMNSNQRAVLLKNEGGNRKNWLGVKLVGTQSNRDGIGAKVKLISGNITQVSEVKSGSSYASGSDLRLLFGLNMAEEVNSIVIEWPSGTVQKLENIPINQTITISESE
ncbi:CRTAC1 family protein [Candidatus Poribacteria bacterium]|nr:CRTAC1 family protein [Candidatus Poribacteria bacterium]